MKYPSINELVTILENIDFHYHEYINECIQFIEQELPATILQEIISDQIITILHAEKQASLSPLRLYWFQKLQDLLYVGELLHSLNNSSSEHESKEFQTEITLFWQHYHFLPVYTENEIKKGYEKKFSEWLGLLEQQVISFYYLHINQHIPLPFPTLYFPVSEIGETKTTLLPTLNKKINLAQEIEIPIIIDHLTDTTLHTKEPLTEQEVTNLSTPKIIQKINDIVQQVSILKKLLPFPPQAVFSTQYEHQFLPGITITTDKIPPLQFLQILLHYSLSFIDLLVEETVIPEDLEELDQYIKQLSKQLLKQEEKNSALIFQDLLTD